METRYLNISLIENEQINKELIFNEAMIKIDSLFNIAIDDFIQDETEAVSDLSYIISTGEHRNHIIYKNINTDKYQYFLPQSNFIVYVKAKTSFYIFDDNGWNKLKY